ncbi:MAG: type II toxin-antitoxin system prevent-host-death family antitoxin [Armatimonadota bacterium]|nr:type II toxin-antitoxin system prevent-host-death family antitoxin [Armatimonadota bacterium]
MLQQMSATAVRNHFSDVVHGAAHGGHHTIICRGERRLAAVIPIEDYDAMEAMEDAYATRALDEAKVDPINLQPMLTIEQVKVELGL